MLKYYIIITSIELKMRNNMLKKLIIVTMLGFLTMNAMEPEKASMPVGDSKSSLMQLTCSEKNEQQVPFEQHI